MSDSPQCRICFKDSKFGQTYKVAGRPLYQCQRCKNVFSKDDFKPIEFEWRSRKEAHGEFMKSLLPKVVVKDEKLEAKVK